MVFKYRSALCRRNTDLYSSVLNFLLDLLRRKSSRYQADYEGKARKMVQHSRNFEIAKFKIGSTNHREFVAENSGHLKTCSTWLKFEISSIQDSGVSCISFSKICFILFIYLLICLFIYLFIYLLIYLFVYSLIHLFICKLTITIY